MFERLTEHIYVYPCDGYTDRPNIGLVRSGSRALLFDAGNSEAHVALMKEALKRQGLPDPDFVAVSHWHWDHSFGMHAWGVPTIAGRETNEKLSQVRKWRWGDSSMEERVEKGEDIVFCNEMIKREYPDRSRICVTAAELVFESRLTVDLGAGVSCELIHAKGPHSSDSVICYVPSDEFLFLGDSNGKDLYGQPWHFDIAHEEDFLPATAALPYDQEKVSDFLRLLDTLDFTHCISGHGTLMTREMLYSSLLTP